MYRTSISFHDRVTRGEVPVPYVLVETGLGWRAFGQKDLADLAQVGSALLDGSYLLDGSLVLGAGYDLISAEARVRSWGRFQRTIKPSRDDLLTSYTSWQQGEFTVTLLDQDGYFTRLSAQEIFIGQGMRVYAGFPDMPMTDHLRLFTGRITEAGVTQGLCFYLTAEEDSDPALSRTLILPRAGRFDFPKNADDPLPLVYGDLSDGTRGNWKLPCIDTNNFVYCYAAHAVMSAAQGNVVTVYVDGEETPASFNHSDPSYDNMATVTFTSDQGAQTVTASGWGKPDGSGALLENLVDIIDDFLVVHCGWTGQWEPGAWSAARSVFEARGFRAAGVVCQDENVWDIVCRIAASFLGNLYVDASGRLVLTLDLADPGPMCAAVVPGADVKRTRGLQQLYSVINRCPAVYAYDFHQQDFQGYDSGDDSADTASMALFGTREPEEPYRFTWCRTLEDVRKVQARITRKLARALWQLEFRDLCAERLHVDVGDHLACTFDDLWDPGGERMINQIFRVVSIQPDLETGFMDFEVVDTGGYLTAESFPLDGSVSLGGERRLGGDRDVTVY